MSHAMGEWPMKRLNKVKGAYEKPSFRLTFSWVTQQKATAHISHMGCFLHNFTCLWQEIVSSMEEELAVLNGQDDPSCPRGDQYKIRAA
jgi:hypothetical protein